MAKSRKNRNRRIRNAARTVIMVCLAAIVVLSGWKTWTIMHNYKVSREVYDRIAELAQPRGWNGDIDFAKLRGINRDIAGWIYYEGTHINYPIVKGSDNDYYLHITFEDTWAVGGTLFVDSVTEKPFDQFNTIVYGHHMQDGTMFGDLKKLKDQGYCREHPQMELVTPEGKYHLRICAFLNRPADSDIYTTNFHNPENMQSYIDSVTAQASYVTGEEMTPDDRLVILSTCAYEYQDARYMVVCRMDPWMQ